MGCCLIHESLKKASLIFKFTQLDYFNDFSSHMPGLSASALLLGCLVLTGGSLKNPRKTLRKNPPRGLKADKTPSTTRVADAENNRPEREVGVGKRRQRRRDTASAASTCHICLAGPQGLKDQLQLPDGCCCLLSTGHVGLQHHFQKANSYQRQAESAWQKLSSLTGRSG